MSDYCYLDVSKLYDTVIMYVWSASRSILLLWLPTDRSDKRKLSRGKSVTSLYTIFRDELVSIYKMTDNFIYMYKIIRCSPAIGPCKYSEFARSKQRAGVWFARVVQEIFVCIVSLIFILFYLFYQIDKTIYLFY